MTHIRLTVQLRKVEDPYAIWAMDRGPIILVLRYVILKKREAYLPWIKFNHVHYKVKYDTPEYTQSQESI